jgi:hypothetical protein
MLTTTTPDITNRSDKMKCVRLVKAWKVTRFRLKWHKWQEALNLTSSGKKFVRFRSFNVQHFASNRAILVKDMVSILSSQLVNAFMISTLQEKL